MITSIEPIDRLVRELSKLPGIGSKTAQRLAYHLVSQPDAQMSDLASALTHAKASIRRCALCGNFSTEELCVVCQDPKRDLRILCVVRDARDVLAFEKSRDFHGRYHVLGGVLSPMEGIGPESLRIGALLERVAAESIEEIILATNPDVEGEATALYIARQLKPLGVRATRIAHGVPIGGNLEYIDEITLSRALAGRREML